MYYYRSQSFGLSIFSSLLLTQCNTEEIHGGPLNFLRSLGHRLVLYFNCSNCFKCLRCNSEAVHMISLSREEFGSFYLNQPVSPFIRCTLMLRQDEWGQRKHKFNLVALDEVKVHIFRWSNHRSLRYPFPQTQTRFHTFSIFGWRPFQTICFNFLYYCPRGFDSWHHSSSP